MAKPGATTAAAQGELLARFDGATSGGSYFVSNYPPFPAWTPDAVAGGVEALDRAPAELLPSAGAEVAPLGVYVHVPFCRKRCHFCYFKVYTGKNSKDVEAYVAGLGLEAALLAKRAAVAGRPVEFLYVGGGTPSYLSVRQVKALKRALAPLVRTDGLRELTFECEPGTLSRPKLEALRELGVTRLSLGVESFDDGVLELNGRAHQAKHIDVAYADARAAGHRQINIDLIAGMLGETEETWAESVRRTVELAPDSVTIYQMELPFNTTIYREMRRPDGVVAPVADWPTKRRWAASAFDALEAAGYALTSGYTAVRDVETATFVYRDALWEGADLLGLGVSAFSHVGGTHFQNDKHIESWLERLGEGELAVQRGWVMSPDERLVREVVLRLKRGVLDRAAVQARHGVDPFERFGEALSAIETHELGRREGERFRLSRAALLQVDRLLPAFFGPEYRAPAGGSDG